jgi:hypothetical protein
MSGGSKHTMACYTCEYYESERKIEPSGHSILADDYARCQNAASDRKGDVISYSQCCQHWIRWRQID